MEKIVFLSKMTKPMNWEIIIIDCCFFVFTIMIWFGYHAMARLDSLQSNINE